MPIVSDGSILFAPDLATTSHEWGTFTGLSVASSGGLSLNVASGIAYLGEPYYILENRTVTIPSGASQDRIDLIQFSPVSGSFYPRIGTAANPAAMPSLGDYELTLARVDIPANATSVSASSLVDKRKKLSFNFREWAAMNHEEGYGIIDRNNSFYPSPSGALNVTIASGITTDNNYASAAFTLTAANATLPRYDLLYINEYSTPSLAGFVNNMVAGPSGQTLVGNIRVATGIAETEPQPPVPYQRRFFPLATIFVRPGTTTLTPSNVIDKRSLRRERFVFIDNASNETITADGVRRVLNVGPNGSNRVPANATHAILSLTLWVGTANKDLLFYIYQAGSTNEIISLHARTLDNATDSDGAYTVGIVPLDRLGRFSYNAPSDAGTATIRVVGYLLP